MEDIGMKKIFLRIPLYWEGNPLVAFKKPVWLKVEESGETVPFRERELNQQIETFARSIMIETCAPNDLEFIEVVCPSMATPIDMIETFWNIAMADKNWKISGLKEVNLVFIDGSRKIRVKDERPDMEDWEEYTKNDKVGSYLWAKPWVLVTYTTECGTYGVLFWKEVMNIKGISN